MPIVPKIASYGSSFGKYQGVDITDYQVSGDIDPSKLNRNLIVDGVEFNLFEQEVRDYVLAQLGYPVIRVELTPFQIKTCIDEAVTKLDYHAPNWAMQYAVFNTQPGINLYELPAFMMNNLNYVVYNKDLLAFQYNQGTLEFDFFVGFWQTNRFYQQMNIGDYLLLQQYMEQIRKVLSREGHYDVIGGKYIQLTPSPTTSVPVIVEYKALDSNTILPSYRNWIQKYALACAKGVLGMIRRKYKNMPGPQGGAQLDGAELVSESKVEKEELYQNLLLEIEEPPFFTAY